MFAKTIDPSELDTLPQASFPGEIVVVDKPGPVLDAAVKYLRTRKVIGFDTESRPSFSSNQPHYGVSLLQLSGAEKAFLFRIKKMGLDPRLASLLANPDVVKVGAAVHDDLKGLAKYQPFEPKGFVDLQKIGSEYGIAEKSVKKMAAIILGVRISKTQQLSNWEAPLLSEAQRKYAATDAWICRQMYKKLSSSEKSPLPEEELHPEQKKLRNVKSHTKKR